MIAAGTVSAQVDVDKTCATCSRLKNDSLNLKVRKIRLNQVGYLPQDPNKAAFVADPPSRHSPWWMRDPASRVYLRPQGRRHAS